MKNTTNIILGIMGLAIAILYYLHFTSCSSSSMNLNPSAKDMAGAAGARMAFINTDSFFKGYKEYIALEKQIENQQKSAQTNAQTRMKSIEAEYMKLTQMAQSGQMNEGQYKSKMQELMQRKNAIEQEAMKLGKDVQDLSDKETKKLYEKLRAYFDKNKSKYNCEIVMGYQTTGALLYYDPKSDITAQLLKDLNN